MYINDAVPIYNFSFSENLFLFPNLRFFLLYLSATSMFVVLWYTQNGTMLTQNDNSILVGDFLKIQIWIQNRPSWLKDITYADWKSIIVHWIYLQHESSLPGMLYGQVLNSKYFYEHTKNEIRHYSLLRF